MLPVPQCLVGRFPPAARGPQPRHVVPRHPSGCSGASHVGPPSPGEVGGDLQREASGLPAAEEQQTTSVLGLLVFASIHAKPRQGRGHV